MSLLCFLGYNIFPLADLNFSLANVLTSVFTLLLLLCLGTTLSTIICSAIVTVVGVPCALLLGRRIDEPLGLYVIIGLAGVVSLVISANAARIMITAGPAAAILTLICGFVYGLSTGWFYHNGIAAQRTASAVRSPE